MTKRREFGSGGIVERRPGRWQVTVELAPDPVSGKRRRRRFTVKGSRTDARRALTSTMAKKDQGIELEPSKILVRDYLERWLDEHARLRVKPSTLLRYRQLVNRLTPFLDGIVLRDLRPVHTQGAYVGLIDDGLAGQTVLHHHRMLKQALKQALLLGMISVNPVDAVTTPRVDRREMRTLSAEEVQRVEGAATDDEFGRLIHVAVTTGLRLGELLGLQWGDVDFEGGRSQVQRTATYRERTTSLGSLKTGKSRRAVPRHARDAAAASRGSGGIAA